MLHRNGPVDDKIWGVMQQSVYVTKICDIYDLQKWLTQTTVDFEQHVIEAAIDQWRDSLRSLYACWWRTLWTHAAKLLFICIMWFIRTFYETVNVIWCIWRLFCDYVIRRIRSGCKRIVNGMLWEMSELITQERIAVGSSNLVEGLTTWLFWPLFCG